MCFASYSHQRGYIVDTLKENYVETQLKKLEEFLNRNLRNTNYNRSEVSFHGSSCDFMCM